MKVVSDSVNKVIVKLVGKWVSSFEFFDVVVSSITKESFFFVFSQQSRDLTCRQDHIDEFEEFFFLDFRVSEDEATILSKSTCDFKILFDIFFEIFFTVVFNQLDLFVIHSFN